MAFMQWESAEISKIITEQALRTQLKLDSVDLSLSH